ncbi:hypothetical protein [Streptomyces sp. NPDC059862]|uniref:hypothetical protein n=1 Tax=unclassified Streptomyces TaxID=2593676 RepID=UPI00363454CA
MARRAIAEGDAQRPLLASRKHDTGQEASGPDSHVATYVRKSAQVLQPGKTVWAELGVRESGHEGSR